MSLSTTNLNFENGVIWTWEEDLKANMILFNVVLNVSKPEMQL